MADYYTQEVVTEPVLLTLSMATALETRGANLFRERDETVLDHLVSGIAASLYSVVFEEGWRGGSAEELLDLYGEDDGEERDKDPEFDRLMELDKHEFFHEVLKINPERDYIELQAAWTCSKMRLDGFGGSGLYVTRKGFRYITTNNVSILKDGTIEFSADFQPWETGRKKTTKKVSRRKAKAR